LKGFWRQAASAGVAAKVRGVAAARPDAVLGVALV